MICLKSSAMTHSFNPFAMKTNPHVIVLMHVTLNTSLETCEHTFNFEASRIENDIPLYIFEYFERKSTRDFFVASIQWLVSLIYGMLGFLKWTTVCFDSNTQRLYGNNNVSIPFSFCF